MKIPKPFLFLFAAILAMGAIAPRQASAQVSVNFFYGNLHPYGEWVNCSYGYCWHPVNVAATWAPYTDGYWAYTDGGWTWVSYEDFGGIVYHYGRWANIEGEGWVWVPGVQWAPAWVSWRSNPEYVGWAPLPPEAVFQAGFGFGGWCDARFNIGPGCYNFVGIGDFCSPALGGVIVNREQNVNIVRNTTNITNITTNNTTINKTVYNGGPSFATVAAHSSRPIPTLHLVRQTSPAALQAANGKLLAHQQGNQLIVPAPKVTAPANGKFPAPPYVAKTLPATAKATHGWDVVKDPQERAALQDKVKTEAPAYAPAKAVNPDDIKLVSQKIKENPQAAVKAGAEGETGVKGEAGTKVEAGAKGEAGTKGETGAKGEAGANGEKLKAGGETTEGKGGAPKTSETALENAKATEAATPKPHKHKTSKYPAETGGATPEPGTKKSKKHPTPEDETPKHSNLQPFNAGNGDEPAKKHSVYGEGNPNGLSGQLPARKHPLAPGANPNGPVKKKQPQPQPPGTPFQ